MRNLIISGFMGAGKTLLGSALANHLDIAHYNTDALVLSALAITEQDIANQLPLFRLIEAKVVRESAQLQNVVVSLGGGAIETPETRGLLKGRPVLWLDPGVDVCWERVQKDSTFRPFAVNYEDFVALYHKRVPLYRECARWHLQSVSPPEQLVKEVLELTGIRA